MAIPGKSMEQISSALRFSQVLEKISLNNTEDQSLVGGIPLLPPFIGPFCPVRGYLQGFFRFPVLDARRGAHVQDHLDIAAEKFLYLTDLLRGEKMARSVDMGLEPDALGGDLSQLGQGENLEPPGVGKKIMPPSR